MKTKKLRIGLATFWLLSPLTFLDSSQPALSVGDYGPDTCVEGYVWREAFSGDHVCVTPQIRTQAAEDNNHAAERRNPLGGDYGPDTCLQGYVWREASPKDHVCVTPETRTQAANDNSQAAARKKSQQGSALADKLPVPAPPNCQLQLFPVNGLIRDEWMRLGGPLSPIGCPKDTFHSDGADGAGVQPFEKGETAISPGVWKTGVVAAYQDGNGIKVDWAVSRTEPSQYDYDEFLVRWDVDGKHNDSGDACSSSSVGLPGDGDQCQVIEDMTHAQSVLNILLHYYNDTHLRTKGTWNLPVGDSSEHLYRIAVEGCDLPTGLGHSKCRQSWMHPVSVNFRTPLNQFDIDYPIRLNAPSANTVSESRAALFRRTASLVLWSACRPLPYNMYRNEEDSTDIVLAKLAYADFYQEDHCPGRTVENRPEAFAWLAQQRVESKTGTTYDHCPGCRTGEYDVVLSGLIPMVFRYGKIMPPRLRAHIVNNLLNKRGPLDEGELTVLGPRPISDAEDNINRIESSMPLQLGAPIVDDLFNQLGLHDEGLTPETENHINMIESSRYLTNDLLFVATHRPEYDNKHNGLALFWLKRLQGYLKTDFIEYNSRPYQTYTMRALQNLASFATDTKVRTAANMVLEYVSAKLAVSSNDLRRVVPYRRKKGYYDDAYSLLAYHADPQSGRLMGLAGNLDILTVPDQGTWGAAYTAGPAETATLANYRISDGILDLILQRSHRVFYQGIHHYADELYASEPSFLLSAGGHYATSAYKDTVVGLFGKNDDIGNALPTTLMPTGRFNLREDLIQFTGDPDDVKRSNMCVAPGFACGMNPKIPRSMLRRRADCVDRSHRDWTFIDFSPHCRGGGY